MSNKLIFPDYDFVESLPGVTRFEVIDLNGRRLVEWGVSVNLSIQDEGRTLKVYITPDKISNKHNETIEGLKR